ncbi:hypothetical protein C8R43DRAFT_1241448 [Mycena crocata]|nr:hypothetical protein C8R43DRAFT_1241448 [Mycena crocata]
MLCDACKHPLLHTDALPTAIQTQELREFHRSGAIPLDTAHYHSQIATSTMTLAQYDSQIQGLQETLGVLLVDRLKLQEYVDGLRAALSPVRSLPAEILGEIFTPFSKTGKSLSSNEEVRALAKSELLELSKVCSRWHHVVLRTPRLWSDIAVNLDLWPGTLADCTLYLNLLGSFLERGTNHPMTISLTINNPHEFQIDVSAMTLLAQHSPRWQHLRFTGCLTALRLPPHNNIKGNLHVLETLAIDPWEEDTVVDIFEIAPGLREVEFAGDDGPCPPLPWSQLRLFSFTSAAPPMRNRGYAPTSFMGRLSHHDAAFEFRSFYAFEGFHRELPTVTSTIASLFLEVIPYFGDIIRGFVLEIPEVTITEDELVRSVTSLASLQRLVISDQLELDGVPEHVLITDTLLVCLTRTADSQLIPRLKHFVCTSFLKFSADVYFDFVASRSAVGETPFKCDLRPFAGNEREFDANVHQKLLEWVVRGDLEFRLGGQEVRMSPYACP